jgi:hypothetical protein
MPPAIVSILDEKARPEVLRFLVVVQDGTGHCHSRGFGGWRLVVAIGGILGS